MGRDIAGDALAMLFFGVILVAMWLVVDNIIAGVTADPCERNQTEVMKLTRSPASLPKKALRRLI